MSLIIGDQAASTGMSKAIYDQLYAIMSPSMSGMKAADFELAKQGWQKLAYAVARGVIEHITSNMEINNVHVGVGGTDYPQSDNGIGHVA